MKDFINFVLQFKIDFITGITYALINGTYSSHKCRKGFEKIIGYLIVKICLLFISFIIPQIKASFHIFAFSVMFIEFSSIIENVKPYLPESIQDFLNKILENVKKENDSKGSGDNG
ncbi:MAG: phage holin family protein [Bacilli bacterium]|nr:phage holin family protein [Bacilli bacterium]